MFFNGYVVPVLCRILTEMPGEKFVFCLSDKKIHKNHVFILFSGSTYFFRGGVLAPHPQDWPCGATGHHVAGGYFTGVPQKYKNSTKVKMCDLFQQSLIFFLYQFRVGLRGVRSINTFFLLKWPTGLIQSQSQNTLVSICQPFLSTIFKTFFTPIYKGPRTKK